MKYAEVENISLENDFSYQEDRENTCENINIEVQVENQEINVVHGNVETLEENQCNRKA